MSQQSSESEIPLSKPDVSALEEELLILTLRSGRLAMGPMTEEFEQAVAERAGCRYGVAVSSGTAGLHLSLRALGIGPGDEVVTTPFSFIASANALLYVGAKPVFVDISPKTLNMDPAKLEAAITPRTKAIMAVEAFGNPEHMAETAQLAAKHEIPMIEDCCEALGTTWKGRKCGSFGRVGVFGFYPNKQITTGEGGMIVTDDQRVAELCRSMRNHGRPAPIIADRHDAMTTPNNTGGWFQHERLGYNYRLSELQAALGVAQMRRLNVLIERRQQVADWYIERLLGMSDLVVPTVHEHAKMSWFVFVVRLGPDYSGEERDRVIRGLRNHEVGCAPYFPCIHLQPHYVELGRELGYGAGSFPISESVSQRTIALPFHPRLSEREVDLVCQTLALMISREQLSR